MSLHFSTLQATQQMPTMKTMTATYPLTPAAATQGSTSTKANNKEQRRLACLKAFEMLHKQWVTFTKKFKNITLAKTFRHTNTTQALYLFVVHKDLFKQATEELRVTECTLPSPLTSKHASAACDPAFTTTLRQHLAKVHVETNTLGGASCYDPAPIFHFPPPPQVITTMPSPPATQPACAQQAPVRCQSPASIPLLPSPPPIDICPPSPPRPTLTHIMPQSDVPNLADAYMHIAPSSPKAKYLWEAFNHAKEYASEARDRTPPLLPMDAEFTSKSHCREACDSPATPITPAMHRHSPSSEAPRTCCNSEDSYNNCKDPSHPLYQYNYREAYHQHILQSSKDRAVIEALEDQVLVPWNMLTSLPPLEEAVRKGLVWEAAPPEDAHCPSSPPSDDAAPLPGDHIPRGFNLNATATLGHSAVDQQLREDCLRMY